MGLRKILPVMLMSIILVTSCEKEQQVLEETSVNFESGAFEKTEETAEDVSDRMSKSNKKFFELTGQSEDLLESQNKASTPPYFAFNSGLISKGSPGLANNTSDPLSYGNRRGTTQWVSVKIENTNINALIFGASVPGTGRVTFNLNGVRQRLYLNYNVNTATNVVTIRPTTSANLHSRIIANSTIRFTGAPLDVTVHSNTNGWMWVQIKQGGNIVFSSLYRYNYNNAWDSRNGGSISVSGFGIFRDSNPFTNFYTSYGYRTNYNGYCGWF